MNSQIMTDLELMTSMVSINAVMLAFFLFFAIITLVKYFQRKSKVALYLSLNYFIYITGLVFLQFGYHDAIEQADKTVLYFEMTAAFLVCVEVGSVMLLLFYTELTKMPKKRLMIMIVIGIGLIIWTILPMNYWTASSLGEGFQFRYVTYTFMVIYMGLIYFDMAKTFFMMARRIDENKFSFNSIAIGGMLFILYFIMITLYGMLQIPQIMFFGMVLILTGQTLFFIGFIIPIIKKKSE